MSRAPQVRVETGGPGLGEDKPTSCLPLEGELVEKKPAEEPEVEAYSQTFLMALLDW
jgi:hypothetical protein